MESVELDRLEIVNFRNFGKAIISPHHRFNIISGHNGAGKTNLLEAIYFLGALRSFRTAIKSELIRSGQVKARLKGTFGGVCAGLVCEIEIGAASRRAVSGGKAVGQGTGHFNEVPMVLFTPATMALVQGEPKTRRRFMDRALFQAERAYPVLRRDYLRALASRNRLLKSKPISRRALEPFDSQLAELGARIVEARARFIEKAAPLFSNAFESISKGLDGTIVYKPNVQGKSEALKEALESSFEKDAGRGFTSRGPHVDDVELFVDGLKAQRFASQGQQRMVVLALKIAETRALAEVTGRIPVLLLDDISSELDRERNLQLFSFLREMGGQAFITTTHLDNILIYKEKKEIVVEKGALRETSV